MPHPMDDLPLHVLAHGAPTPGYGLPYVGWAARQRDENGDPIDVPKRTKYDARYVIPPDGAQMNCGGCKHFRAPDACVVVGNTGAVIYPEGSCKLWDADGALFSTPEMPNPGDDNPETTGDIEEEPEDTGDLPI